MDCIQTNNAQSCNFNKKSQLCEFLDGKIGKSSITTDEDSQISVKPTHQKAKLIPQYSFKFGKHTIGESVQYQIQLIQQFKIFSKTITQKYSFKTQYSKLEKLSQKLKSNNFPSKKWFGNKDPLFIEKRKKQLSAYLNNIAKQKSAIFYQFVLQIKEASFCADSKKIFTL